MARRAPRRVDARLGVADDDADVPPGLRRRHRVRRRAPRRAGHRPPRLHRPQAHRARDLPAGRPRPGQRGDRRLLGDPRRRLLPVVGQRHHRLQGHAHPRRWPLLTGTFVDERRRERGRPRPPALSTNTFLSWPLAHPYRVVAHNGEIKHDPGQSELDAGPRGATDSPLLLRLGAGVPDLHPRGERHRRARRGAEPRARRLLARGSRAHDDPGAVGAPHRDADERCDFYRYHATRMEPWDGPASIVLTDGRIGASPDRNGSGRRGTGSPTRGALSWR
ncbi:MAG: hypothetical protein R2695_10625 [Acidimicrobiales bacterium]